MPEHCSVGCRHFIFDHGRMERGWQGKVWHYFKCISPCKMGSRSHRMKTEMKRSFKGQLFLKHLPRYPACHSSGEDLDYSLYLCIKGQLGLLLISQANLILILPQWGPKGRHQAFRSVCLKKTKFSPLHSEMLLECRYSV